MSQQPTIWEQAYAAYQAASTALQKHVAQCKDCDVYNGVFCKDARKLIDACFEAPRFPSGFAVIQAGQCPVGATTPSACFLCQYGHMTECHYPQNCAEAKCSHSGRNDE